MDNEEVLAIQAKAIAEMETEKKEESPTVEVLAEKEQEMPSALVAKDYFVATNGEEMAQAQAGVTAWISAKVNSMKREVSDLSKALNIARERKWATSALIRQRNLALGRRKYYEKVLDALKAGYVLIPAFPVDIFAVRISRETPLPQATERINQSWEGGIRPTYASEKLPTGEGDYKAAHLDRYSNSHKWKANDGKENTTYRFFNDDEFSDVAFPLIAAKAEVMESASNAMAKRIFDEIGIVTQNSRQQNRRASMTAHGDPLIIGTIVGPKVGYNEKRCHFLITWHVNVEDI